MAAGIVYEGQVILDDYPCDISSIVRYRGGFNINSEHIEKFKGYRFPAFTPIYVNFTLREVAFVTGASDFEFPSTWDDTTQYINMGSFTYNKILVEEGATVTAVLKANEISFTGLTNLRYYNATGTETAFGCYEKLLTSSDTRNMFIQAYSKSTFIW